MTTPRILATTALIGLATSAAAFGAGAAPDFDRAPYLGTVSGGAGVQFDLDEAAKRTSVTISGKRARPTKVVDKEKFVYRAFIANTKLKPGRMYKVTVKVTGDDGTSRTFSKRLYQHDSMNAPE